MALTIKQEKFCQLYIELGNASEAYRQSYDCSNYTEKSINESASRLLKNVKVLSRVLELKQAAEKRHNITVDDIIDQLLENRKYALEADTVQSSAATAASMGIAKVLGLVVDKQQIDAKHTVKTARDLTDDDLANIATGSSARVAE